MAPKHKSRKTSAAQKKKNDAEKQSKVKENGAIQDEIILVIALVVSILLFLSNFNLSGRVGKIVSGFIFGLVGAQGYILPFIIFLITAFYISNMGNKRAGRKIISAIVFFIALAALIQLFTNADTTLKIQDYYLNSYKNKNGGGIIGGIFVMIFCKLFEKVATGIILIAIMLITIIIITGKAIITYLANKGKSSFKERMEYQRLRKEEKDEIAAELKNYEEGRRPPKTFVIDKTTPTTLKETQNVKSESKDTENISKDKRFKKEKTSKEEELPILNFHHLFEEEYLGDEHKGVVPTYEEELRLKFGNTGVELDEKPDDIE
ncbi:MAG: DNA translocase FtsK 4TM domain-containing protein, partial [Herbinix sp.]|nr:DNA translocase FtsK 4TM domain-containing protein [Herbinix sp.]